MSRFARSRRVFFLEEPIFEGDAASLRRSICPESGVHVFTPVIPDGLSEKEKIAIQEQLLERMLEEYDLQEYVAWYYTPMAREIAADVLKPRLTVYDCMDDLSAFAGAPATMKANEKSLFRAADLVFTGGASLYESKRTQHASVHLFPSGVDRRHFARARSIENEPGDQTSLAHPRLGYAGVIDERMDLELVETVAISRPEWQLVFIGPVVKINPKSLPRARNIHYLGLRPYRELPAYMSGWNVAMLPFALNESTRFISPTKTPEYLAAGLPVVSTAITDVVKPYGQLGLVAIAKSPEEFIEAVSRFLERPPSTGFYARVDDYLSQSSWDTTWIKMNELVEQKTALATLSASQPQTMHSGTGLAKAAHV